MLKGQRKKHLSFHTPGHKKRGKDITELSYSDNLCSPTGVLKRAENDVAEILGAERSFLLTDGSTCGVLSMLYALKLQGATSVAVPRYSHPSVLHGCLLAGLTPILLAQEKCAGIFLPPTLSEIERGLQEAQALLLTSPDYYGNFPDMVGVKELCKREKKPLLIDGAHGAHLHFTGDHASKYAQMWVDGAHKSLPALTQGAVVSANAEFAPYLKESVSLFRTTSPSYPVLASVEEAIKYPRNEKLERVAREYKMLLNAYENADWSKILIAFGKECDRVQSYLEKRGIYPEFNDGNYLMFYLSPATKISHLKKLRRALEQFPRAKILDGEAERAPHGEEREECPLSRCVGRVSAQNCGLFPPCIPIVAEGEIFTQDTVDRLRIYSARAFGVTDGKVLVYKEK